MNRELLQKTGRGLLLALGFFALGLVLRLLMQGIMGTRLVWLTFYPVLTLSAILAGFWSGLLTALLSAAFAVWGGALLGGQPFVKDWADWLGLMVFLFNATMISLVAQSMRRANRKSREAQKEAEAANRAKSIFLAQMSHELRTPFNALLGFTRMLVRAPETPESQRDILRVIDRSANHLLDLINNVLDISRIESKQQPLEHKGFYPRDLAGEVLELLGKRISDKGLKARLTVDSSVPEVLMGAPGRIRQILVNLMGNAVKFSSRGTIEINLTCREFKEARTAPPTATTDGSTGSGTPLQLVLQVCDQGIGIAPEYHSAIFEPFRQIGNEGLTEGSGLGLAIVKQAALGLGGTVEVQSSPGQGACFTVVIPVSTVVPGTGLADGIAVSTGPLKTMAGCEGHRFLIVDDQADNRLLMAALHQELAQDYRLAENGTEALAVFKDWKPELVWMDLRMPGMDGIQTMKTIKNLPGGRDVPVVAVTASVFNEEKAALVDAGFSEVLYKPFPAEQIQDIMTRFVGIGFTTTGIPAPAAAASAEGSDELAGLTEPERTALLAAVGTLDPEHMEAQVRILQGTNPRAAAVLQRYLDQLDYAGLRSILERRGRKQVS